LQIIHKLVKIYKGKKHLLYPLVLLLIYFLFVPQKSAEASTDQKTQKTEFHLDWKKAKECQRLKDKYTFLSEEYERITRQWEKIIVKALEKHPIHPDLDKLYSLLDDEVYLIRPFIFQKLSAENAQANLEDISSTEKVFKIIQKWNKEYASILKDKKVFNPIKELMTACWAWKSYTRLAVAADKVNLIFYDGFESDNLSEWKTMGIHGYVRTDSEKKAKGKQCLTLHNDGHSYNVVLCKESIYYIPIKIRRDWWAWLPASKIHCQFTFKICGIDCWWASHKYEHYFVFQGKEKIYKKALLPNHWYYFSVITDFQKELSDVFINNRIVFKNIPLLKYVNKVKVPLYDIQISGFYFEPNTGWIDEIKISYVD